MKNSGILRRVLDTAVLLTIVPRLLNDKLNLRIVFTAYANSYFEFTSGRCKLKKNLLPTVGTDLGSHDFNAQEDAATASVPEESAV